MVSGHELGRQANRLRRDPEKAILCLIIGGGASLERRGGQALALRYNINRVIDGGCGVGGVASALMTPQRRQPSIVFPLEEGSERHVLQRPIGVEVY